MIKEMAKGKEAAFERFDAAYGRFIYVVAASVSKSSYLAEEIVDDVLVKIWQKASTLKYIEKPLGWLYIITSNCAKDKHKNEKPFSEIYDIPQDDKNIERFVMKEAFLSHIAPLNEEERLIMILKFIQDLSLESIAKALNKPLSTASSTYYRALNKLKQTTKKF
ncbi:MAG: sigma-70 family RNA polymerase sigma factor [Clostridia bacterium]|nr:sigma-70 family RNA polymerase sigma factor [Clostridia bacterium]